MVSPGKGGLNTAGGAAESQASEEQPAQGEHVPGPVPTPPGPAADLQLRDN